MEVLSQADTSCGLWGWSQLGTVVTTPVSRQKSQCIYGRRV